MSWLELADGHTSGVENTGSSNNLGHTAKKYILLKKAVLNWRGCQYFLKHFPAPSNVISD